MEGELSGKYPVGKKKRKEDVFKQGRQKKACAAKPQREGRTRPEVGGDKMSGQEGG